MVTIYIKGAWTIWVDCVNTADPLTELYSSAQFLAGKNNNDNTNNSDNYNHYDNNENKWKWIRGIETRKKIETHYYLHVSDVLLFVTCFGTSTSFTPFKWTVV